jgi:hypothetical protein
LRDSLPPTIEEGRRLVVGGGVVRPRAGRGSLLTKEEGRWKPAESRRRRGGRGQTMVRESRRRAQRVRRGRGRAIV